MEFEQLFNDPLINSLTKSFVVLLVAIFLLRSLSKGFGQIENTLSKLSDDQITKENQRRGKTLTRLSKQAVALGIWVVSIFIILREFNIDMGPLLASAGILGLAVGFGAQNLVRDVLSGIFVLFEEQMHIGDEVEINGYRGKVENIFFRTLHIRDSQGAIHIIPNGSIKSLSNYSRDWSAVRFELKIFNPEKTDRQLLSNTLQQAVLTSSLANQLLEPKTLELQLNSLDNTSATYKGQLVVPTQERMSSQNLLIDLLGSQLAREKLEFSIASL